jgi:hypothetical protein
MFKNMMEMDIAPQMSMGQVPPVTTIVKETTPVRKEFPETWLWLHEIALIILITCGVGST